MKTISLYFIFLFSLTSLCAQNVGVGTASPTAKLHIAGDFRIESLNDSLVIFPPGILPKQPVYATVDGELINIPPYPNEEWYNVGCASFTSNNINLVALGDEVFVNDNSTSAIFAPVVLPVNATIKQLFVGYIDNGAGNLQITLYRTNSSLIVGQVTTNNGSTFAVLNSFINDTIEDGYDYYIDVRPVAGTWESGAVKIEYIRLIYETSYE